MTARLASVGAGRCFLAGSWPPADHVWMQHLVCMSRLIGLLFSVSLKEEGLFWLSSYLCGRDGVLPVSNLAL